MVIHIYTNNVPTMLELPFSMVYVAKNLLAEFIGFRYIHATMHVFFFFFEKENSNFVVMT
jgi:hypothetical protein